MAVESRPAPYRRRHPETTALYQVVQQHLETYLARAGEEDRAGQPVPAYVEREFRRYLQCGILAYSFARARCPDCGHDFLVAFSCKGRGLCLPAGGALHLSVRGYASVAAPLGALAPAAALTWLAGEQRPRPSSLKGKE